MSKGSGNAGNVTTDLVNTSSAESGDQFSRRTFSFAGPVIKKSSLFETALVGAGLGLLAYVIVKKVK